jgi:hypothetical protein
MRTNTLTFETVALPANTVANVLRCARNVALFAAAPFIGLAYALAFPFVGVAALAWVAVRAYRERIAA